MNGETVGRSLREAREACKLSLEQISQATYIRLRYLQAMEAGDFDSLPSQTQTRGFLRTVANFLKIDPEPLLAAIEEGAADLSTQEIEPVEPSSAVRIASTAPQPAQDASGQEEIRSIFIGIGQKLQNRRELLGLSIEDVERHTRLRSHYLKSLESGDLDKLPSPVQGRGMLNNYAIFLGVDPEPLLLRFADGLQARLALRQGRPTVSSNRHGGWWSPIAYSASCLTGSQPQQPAPQAFLN